MLGGVDLERGEVCGDAGPGVELEEVLGDGDGEGGTFFRVGGGAEFVKQDEGLRVRRAREMWSTLTTCEEKEERLRSMDWASPISAKMEVKSGKVASSAGTRKPDCAMRERRPSCFEGDGFSAGVGAGDDELTGLGGEGEGEGDGTGGGGRGCDGRIEGSFRLPFARLKVSCQDDELSGVRRPVRRMRSSRRGWRAFLRAHCFGEDRW